MADAGRPDEGPPIDEIESVFRVADVRTDGDELYYIGRPRVQHQTLEEHLWPRFRKAGYELLLRRRTGDQFVLVARPRTRRDGIPWLNLILLVATVGSTLFVGSQWYYVDLASNPLGIVRAWPFVVAILGVLGVHELGHLVMIRYHDVDASLPYFIPFPSLIGTAGAVIRMRGRIPDRKALFDIGASGPLAGLVATVVVTVIGLHLDPIAAPDSVANAADAVTIQIHYPLLLQFIAAVVGESTGQAHPVVFGGWVGMFITFLNLLPVGQFDGGHIVRAMLGRRQETVAVAVPAALFGLAVYLYMLGGRPNAVILWAVWGVFTTGLAYAGPADPIRDEPLDRRRTILGIVTLVLGLLCFTPVPIEIQPVPFTLPTF
jgi:membrane-associated protease RseP (regulator of RpoE activity)